VALIALALHKIEVSLVGIIILFLSLLASIFFIKNTDWFYKNIYTLLLNTLAILIFSAYVMKSNELLINSVKPVATFVNSLKSNNVYVYNYLLPSMCFYTNKNIITINNGNYTSKREVQFEQNLNYLKTYYNFEEKKEISRFKANFKINDAVFLVRKKENLPDYIKTKLHFRHKKYFGKWILYYN
jgi:4-amino-4-deoxy-L-arabinose transferase